MYSNYVNALNGGGTAAGTNPILAAGQPEQYGKVISQLENSNQSLMNILQEYNEKYEGLAKHCEVLKRNEEIVRNHLFESNVKWINFLKEVIILTNEVILKLNFQKLIPTRPFKLLILRKVEQLSLTILSIFSRRSSRPMRLS